MEGTKLSGKRAYRISISANSVKCWFLAEGQSHKLIYRMGFLDGAVRKCQECFYCFFSSLLAVINSCVEVLGVRFGQNLSRLKIAQGLS